MQMTQSCMGKAFLAYVEPSSMSRRPCDGCGLRWFTGHPLGDQRCRCSGGSGTTPESLEEVRTSHLKPSESS